MTLETNYRSPSNAIEQPSVQGSSGTEPDEWRLGEYDRIVVETDGSPR